MSTDVIRIRGARVHNLKNINVEIPKNKIVVITGVSGSGKSSLAFDTIYAEGQRRYVESLSSYARQFLGIMEKPDVDHIEGLSPAIAIDQKTASNNPRSTVGTTTEIYDYLRLLFARVGDPFCYKCGRPIQAQTVQQIVDSIMDLSLNQENGVRIMILSPVVRARKGEFADLFDNLFNKGFARVRVDGEMRNLEEEIKLNKHVRHDIEIVVDRLVIPKRQKDDSLLIYQQYGFDNEEEYKNFKQRITDSVETALHFSQGEVIVNLFDEKKDIFYSENLVCPKDQISYPKIEPHTFSFNSPHGACPKCAGLGFVKEISPELVYNPNLTIMEGAIFPWSRNLDDDSWYVRILKALADKRGFSLRVPMKDLPKEIIDEILFGSEEILDVVIESGKFKGSYQTKFEGVMPSLYRRYNESESDLTRQEIEKYMITNTCTECNGTRLKKEVLGIKVGGKNIIEVTKMNLSECFLWVESLESDELVKREFKVDGEIYHEYLTLSKQKSEIAHSIIREIRSRLQFLIAVGLNYLTLDRTMNTLSGGEAQRIRLASQIGSGLSGVLYVLDEPSIGLHQRDNDRLINTLKNLRDLGNTVIVVEHDMDTIKNADYIIDMGEGAGVHGGKVIFAGDLNHLKKDTFSVTAPYVRGEKIVGHKYISRSENISLHKLIRIKGARQNNLKNIDVSIPLGKFVCVTGVSGSGKSTLINDILYTRLHNYFYNTHYQVGLHDYIEGIENIDKVIAVDQSPIGRTPRSNPATYVGFFDDIRNLFANTNEAKMRGYKSGRFSFNVKGGRCESCRGDGIIKIEMQFLPDVYVTCESCGGKRYNRETLEITYRGKNIYEVLEMTVDEALEFFQNIPRIHNKLSVLQQVGLGYIKLGQQANTLSGGESQRIKLATELAKKNTGRTLYILDEPTTGLHFEDVNKLLDVLHSLRDKGNTILVIEHNLDIIKTADYIIDLGPEGGDGGGEIVACGTPHQIIQNLNSWTGKYLKDYLV